MVRNRWKNLNGLWDYAIVDRGEIQPPSWTGKILVPFAAEAALSGVGKAVRPDQRLWYRRAFEVPSDWGDSRVLLHFGAVDWHAEVWLNGIRLGEHKGGYTPFSFEGTRALKPRGMQQITVSVWDPTDSGTQARGKQVSEPEGIWYTSVTGIWQTVWIEPVPESAIARLDVTPDLDGSRVVVRASADRASNDLRVRAVVRDGGSEVGQATGAAGADLSISISNPKLWSPDSPHLYDLEVSLLDGSDTVDRVESYLGMRKIALGEDKDGFLKLFLNNKEQFMLGPLDQGWWPDGLYTAPTDEALRYDIEITKKLGFNTARKHVKVEPARWYYHCDRLGLIVWQDMPNGNLRRGQPNNLRIPPEAKEDAPREGVSASQFESEWRELIDALRFFPSIVMWVPFNEGWGQYDTKRIAEWTKKYDPTRLVNAPSGWTDRGAGDVYDVHLYPGPGIEDPGPNRAAVLGEFGGLGWPVDDHLWWTNKRNWGYRTFFNRKDLNDKYVEIVGNVRGVIGRGVAAAIYTQTTDVEGEVNGLMTYDRKLVKFDADKLNAVHDSLYKGVPKARVLLTTSEHAPQDWRYTFSKPAGEWASISYDDNSWSEGPGPFQNGGDAMFSQGTEWRQGGLWVRRGFELDELPDNLWLEIYQTIAKGTVYVNGTKLDSLDGRRPTRRHYRHANVSNFASALRKGKNVIAIHAEQAPDGSDGEQGGFDVGLYALGSE